MDRGAWQAIVHGSQGVGLDWVTSLLLFDLLYWLLVVVDLQIFHVAFSTMVTFTPLGKEQCRKKVMPHIMYMGFSRGTSGKGPPANVGNRRDSVLIPGSGSSPGVGNGNLLQYSFLENSSDRGAWQAAVHRLAKSRTWLSTLKRPHCCWTSKHLTAPVKY